MKKAINFVLIASKNLFGKQSDIEGQRDPILEFTSLKPTMAGAACVLVGRSKELVLKYNPFM